MKVMGRLQWYSANTHSVFIYDIQQPTYTLKETTLRTWSVFGRNSLVSKLRLERTHFGSPRWNSWCIHKHTQPGVKTSALAFRTVNTAHIMSDHATCTVLFFQDVFRRGSWKENLGNVHWFAVYPLSATIWGQEHLFCVHVPPPTPLPLASCHSTNYRKV